VIYKRHKIYWYDFTFQGRRYQESTHISNREEALDIEAARRTELARGEVGLVDRPKYTIHQLLDRLEARWRMEHKAPKQNLSVLKRVRESFPAGKMAHELTTTDLDRFALERQKQDYRNGTINKVMIVLRRAFNLAKVPWPEFEMLSVAGSKRKGFFSPEQIAKLLPAFTGLPERLRGVLLDHRDAARGSHGTALVLYPWQSDYRSLEYCKTKDDEDDNEPHMIPIAGQLVPIIKRRGLARTITSNGTAQFCDFIFHRDGNQIADFTKAWRTATSEAGCTGKLFHDLRRSAARNMVLKGIPQATAMKITGHLTDSMFRRYAILEGDDIAAALEKLAATQGG
jgi:Phage integrase family